VKVAGYVTRDPLSERYVLMLKKLTLVSFFLGMSIVLAFYVYPTHPVLVWVLLGLCWACFRLGLRAQRLFRKQKQNVVGTPASPSAR
jgi:hypothetical protein